MTLEESFRHVTHFSSIRSAVNDVLDRQSTVVDQIGRAIFRSLRQLPVPHECLFKTAATVVLGLPDVRGAGANYNGDGY